MFISLNFVATTWNYVKTRYDTYRTRCQMRCNVIFYYCSFLYLFHRSSHFLVSILFCYRWIWSIKWIVSIFFLLFVFWLSKFSTSVAEVQFFSKDKYELFPPHFSSFIHLFVRRIFNSISDWLAQQEFFRMAMWENFKKLYFNPLLLWIPFSKLIRKFSNWKLK